MSDSILPLEITNLPVNERLLLVEQLWNSIAKDVGNISLTEEQKLELDRRLETLRTNPESGSCWEIVKQRLLDRT